MQPHAGVMVYTLRDLDLPLSGIVDLVGETDLEGVELGDWVWPMDEDEAERRAVAAALEENDLTAHSAIARPEKMEAKMDDLVEAYRPLGADTLVVLSLDGEYFETREGVRDAAKRLDDLADEAADRDFRVLYHNHFHEFTDLGDTNGYELLMEETERAGFEVDNAWIAAGGMDPAAVIRELGGERAPIVHMKGGYPEEQSDAELGEGTIDQQATADAAVEAGVEWLNYEYGSSDDPRASLEHGARKVIEYRDAALR